MRASTAIPVWTLPLALVAGAGLSWLAVTSLSRHHGASDTGQARAAILSSLKDLGAETEVKMVQPAPIAGLFEVRTDTSILYFSQDGQYLLNGDVIEVASRSNVSESVRSQLRGTLLSSSDPTSHVRYGPANNPRTVYVFTDITCGYCRKFHEEVPELVAAGVTVEYLPWPRDGRDSAVGQEMQGVWCAADKAQAYDQAMAGQLSASADCQAVVDAGIKLGHKLGVSGTPGVFARDGRQLGGYLTAAELLGQLN